MRVLTSQSVKALFQSTHQKLRARFPAEFGKRSIYSLQEFLWGWGLIYSRAFDIEVPVDLERDRAAGSERVGTLESHRLLCAAATP